MPTLTQTIYLLTAVNAVLAAAILFVRWRGGPSRRWPIRMDQVVLAALVVCVSAVVALFFRRRVGANIFGLVHFWYVQIVILLPVLALLVLVHRSWRPHGSTGPGTTPMVTAAALLGLLAAPVGVYASFIEPYWLQTERQTIETAAIPDDAFELRVGVLADIQTRTVDDYERRAIDALMAEKPDLILITGDMIQAEFSHYVTQIEPMRELMAQLDAPAGVFAVLGDVDPPTLTRQLFQGTRVRLLVNEIADIEWQGQQIAIGGTQRQFESSRARRMLLDLAARDAYRIAVSHDPSIVAMIAPMSAVDLVAAGHTHGGQVQLPFVGPLVTATSIPRRFAAGFNMFDGVAMYVSRGVGFECGQAPPLRFLCPPEISVLTIRGRAGS